MKRVIAATKFDNIDQVKDDLKRVQTRLERFKNADESYSSATIKKLRDAYSSVEQALSSLNSI